ncbi:hypothetical protein BC835DRAFT_992094 [Cytidiella melzeri]|nr:hypothetical protein BC835DRAFT_992094 [Cytidiella melzeri]
MADSRQRIPLQSSYSFSDIPTASTSIDAVARSLKRRNTSTDPSLPNTSTITTTTTTTSVDMNAVRPQSHYAESAYYVAKPPSSRPPVSSSRAPLPITLPPMDPTPDDEDAVFIHPPFSDFPNAHMYMEGLTYTVMAANPNWFLDPTDYQTVNGGNSTAVKYPTQLEPPRGWCPSKKKEAKESWPDGEEPRLRCTFCRRTYAGVNAKSMWRRHVFEKHKIAMSNRRVDNQERKGRHSNKENKEDANKSGAARGAARAEQELEALVRAPGMKTKSRSTGQHLENSQASSSRGRPIRPAEDTSDDEDTTQPETIEPQLVGGDSFMSFDLDSSDVFRVATSSSTPPLTPGLSPSSSARFANHRTDSPYNPLLTPSFRHSPARLPSDQPWRFPSPSHPLHSSARELSLSMLVCGEASPLVRGLDVSPVVLMPASERSKRSIFSSPIPALKKDTETPGLAKGFLKDSPRRLFSESGLPTPFTDRLKFQKHRIPESPLGKGFTPAKSKAVSSLTQRSDVFRSSFSPVKTSSPLKTPHKGTGLLGAFDLENDDPFETSLYKAWLRSPSVMPGDRPISPPDSSPECESPILRASQLTQTDSLPNSQAGPSAPRMVESDSSGLGIGLMAGFSLKDRTASSSSISSEAEVDEELSSSANPRKRPAKWLGRSFATADGSPAPVVQAGKRIKREFLMDRLLNGDLDFEMHEASQPKKRRKTIGSRE